jgi:hypothetical protein
MNGAIAIFISLLLGSPLSALNPQSVGDMWDKAEAQAAPSPTPTATVKRQTPSRRQAVQTPTPAPTPSPFAASITPPPDEEGPGHQAPDGDGPTASPVAHAQANPTPWGFPSQAAAMPAPAPTAWSWPAATPTPPAVAFAPVAIPTLPAVVNGNGGPIYSSYFTGDTPYHKTVAALMGAGGQLQSPTIAQNYWGQGIFTGMFGSQSGGAGPIYAAKASDPGVTFSCHAYGTCNASGRTVRYPAGATIQSGSDHHVSSFDLAAGGETDGWGCNSLGHCAWGGFFPFSGDGLAPTGSSGDAGGAAFGLHDITAQELLNGHIDHSVGLEQSCLDDGGVYPAMVGKKTDAPCNGRNGREPNARYGYLIAINPAADVTKYGYGKYCTVIVQAMQKYGGYTMDNNSSYGIFLNVDAPQNPYADSGFAWFTIILPEMAAAGDARRSGQTSYSWSSCLQRIPASDIVVIRISPKLP